MLDCWHSGNLPGGVTSSRYIIKSEKERWSTTDISKLIKLRLLKLFGYVNVAQLKTIYRLTQKLETDYKSLTANYHHDIKSMMMTINVVEDGSLRPNIG